MLAFKRVASATGARRKAQDRLLFCHLVFSLLIAHNVAYSTIAQAQQIKLAAQIAPVRWGWPPSMADVTDRQSPGHSVAIAVDELPRRYKRYPAAALPKALAERLLN